jgi:putative ABC transport system permease protein
LLNSSIRLAKKIAMIKNYLKIALRNLKRNITISAINIFGLTFGLAIASLIVLYVQNELTYDAYHKDAKQIYRIDEVVELGGYSIGNTRVCAPMGPYLVEKFPKVIAQTRISRPEDLKFEIGENSIEEEIFYADSTYFQIFTFDFIFGNPKTALIEPFSLVLTKHISEKFYGNKNPVGEVIKAKNGKLYKVTAVVEDTPQNTHLKVNMISSFASLYQLMEGENKIDGWGLDYNSYGTYIKLSKEYPLEQFKNEFPIVVKTFLSDKPDQVYKHSFQAIKDIYLYHDGGGDLSRVILFAVIGIFVLIIACINYMNLNTTDSVKRLKEIGMRKVLGAGRKQLIRQLLFESIALSMVSLILALTLAEILLPIFNNILQKDLSFEYLSNWPLSLTFVMLAFLTGVLGGTYPAFYLSAIIPVNALKGKFVFGSKHAFFRNILVVLQFAITIFLICCTGIIYMQIRHTSKSDLGFQKENVLILELQMKQTDQNSNKAEDFNDNTTVQIRNELNSFPEISMASIASGFPFGSIMVGHYKTEGIEKNQTLISYLVDNNYIDLLKLKIIDGEGFSEHGTVNKNEVIINETLARIMNWDIPIGKTFTSSDDKTQEFKVIGLIKDYHVKSFRDRIYPIYLKYDEQPKYFRSIGIKYQTTDVQGLISRIENVSHEIDPSQEITTKFMFQIVEDEYMEEYRTGKMFTNFAILAIIIAAMGLYGLALFISKQKTKEIGVRKVFGGSIEEIIIILSKNFIKLVVIAAIIGIPAAWYYMDKWLQTFVYQVQNRWIVFVLATILAIVIAFVTIFYQSYKAANSNPVDALKYE